MTFHFEIGDVVRLRDTEMKMIVVSTDTPDYRTRCSWYDVEGNPNRYSFRSDALELAPAQSGRFPGRR